MSGRCSVSHSECNPDHVIFPADITGSHFGGSGHVCQVWRGERQGINAPVSKRDCIYEASMTWILIVCGDVLYHMNLSQWPPACSGDIIDGVTAPDHTNLR